MVFDYPKYYELSLCGLVRRLPVIKLNHDLAIASFVMLGDTELIERSAAALAAAIDRRDQIELLVCPEAKAIPLTHALARILDVDYVVVRKEEKAYMRETLVVESRSITTSGKQRLILDGPDVRKLNGKKVFLVDDVVSTGESLKAVLKILSKVNCSVIGKGAVLLEEARYPGEDLVFLDRLPVFRRD